MHPQIDHDLHVKRLQDTLRDAEPYLGHLSNCALMTALPTARIGAFECTCGYRKLKYQVRNTIHNARA